MASRQQTIDEYIGDCAEAVVPLLKELRSFIHTAMPGATETMRYGAPYFSNKYGVPVIYLFGSKRHVNFGFLRSSELKDPLGVLKGSGKPSKHIKVFPEEPADKELPLKFIAQCESMRS